MTTRIQRSRRRGSRLPADAICITRPGPWGNPFRAVDYPQFADPRRFVVDAFRWYLMFDAPGMELAERARRELCGRKLACWCRVDECCHGDVLIDAAERTLWRDWERADQAIINLVKIDDKYQAIVYAVPGKIGYASVAIMPRHLCCPMRTVGEWPTRQLAISNAMDTAERANEIACQTRTFMEKQRLNKAWSL